MKVLRLIYLHRSCHEKVRVIIKGVCYQSATASANPPVMLCNCQLLGIKHIAV